MAERYLVLMKDKSITLGVWLPSAFGATCLDMLSVAFGLLRASMVSFGSVLECECVLGACVMVDSASVSGASWAGVVFGLLFCSLRQGCVFCNSIRS